MCMFLHAEGARAEAGSHRAPPAGSNAEPGRTTAASVSSIPCRRSPASPASSLCGVGLRQKSVLDWCGSVGRQGSPDRWMILGSAFSLDSSLCALVLHSRLVFESPPLLLQSLSRTPGGLRLHCHKRAVGDEAGVRWWRWLGAFTPWLGALGHFVAERETNARRCAARSAAFSSSERRADDAPPPPPLLPHSYPLTLSLFFPGRPPPFLQTIYPLPTYLSLNLHVFLFNPKFSAFSLSNFHQLCKKFLTYFIGYVYFSPASSLMWMFANWSEMHQNVLLLSFLLFSNNLF